MFVKLPTWLSTLRKWSGRSHATVNAQMPPELMPQIARRLGIAASGCTSSPTSGRISSIRKRAYWSPSESYSKLRLLGLQAFGGQLGPARGRG